MQEVVEVESVCAFEAGEVPGSKTLQFFTSGRAFDAHARVLDDLARGVEDVSAAGHDGGGEVDLGDQVCETVVFGQFFVDDLWALLLFFRLGGGASSPSATTTGSFTFLGGGGMITLYANLLDALPDNGTKMLPVRRRSVSKSAILAAMSAVTAGRGT